MHRHIRGLVSGALFLGLAACSGSLLRDEQERPELCSARWFGYVEQRVKVSDEQGHGPDIGSSEWMSAVEFKLGIRGEEQVPAQKSRAWCAYVDSMLHKSR